jgi:hypothetical protein
VFQKRLEGCPVVARREDVRSRYVFPLYRQSRVIRRFQRFVLHPHKRRVLVGFGITGAFPHDFPLFRIGIPLSTRGARGIEAEILFCGAAAKKIGAKSPARRAHVFLNLLTVPNWLQFGGFPDFGRYFLKL